MFDPASVMVWVDVGGQLIKIGTGAIAKIRESLSSTDETGNALLDNVIADYDRRIAVRENEARPTSDQ